MRDQWTKGRYGFMYYKGDDDNRKGRLVVPCGKYTSAAEMYDFIRKIQGLQASDDATSSDGQPWPYEGTPTGEAFNEVYNYLKQNGSGINSGMMSKGSVPEDPYYTTVDVNGTLTDKPVSCRNTYVVHMSDGNWYRNSGSTIDPLPKVYQLHTENLRDDIATAGMTPITANIFSILAFADPGDCVNCSTAAVCRLHHLRQRPLRQFLRSPCDYFLGQNCNAMGRHVRRVQSLAGLRSFHIPVAPKPPISHGQ